MKRIVALVLLAALGLVVAGCASAKKGGSVSVVMPTYGVRSPGAITVSGTATISQVKPGTTIRCKGGPKMKVPAGERGGGVASYMVGEGIDSQSGSRSIQLTFNRSPNGTVTVSCTRK